MINGDWREETLESLERMFKERGTVISFSLFGSLSKPEVEKDRWSDIDALVIVRDDALHQFYPDLEWLSPLGKIFASQLTKDDNLFGVKVIFNDFKKIDFVITTESTALKGIKVLTRQKVLLSNNETISKLLNEAPLSVSQNPTNYPFDKLIEDYWYTSFVAVTKLIRNDLLISLHLALELYRKCLELGMWLRDRESGTNIHRIGGIRNELVEKMNIRLNGTSKKDILELISQSGKEFDKLAKEWSSDYKEHFPTFENLLHLAQEDL